MSSALVGVYDTIQSVSGMLQDCTGYESLRVDTNVITKVVSVGTRNHHQAFPIRYFIDVSVGGRNLPRRSKNVMKCNVTDLCYVVAS